MLRRSNPPKARKSDRDQGIIWHQGQGGCLGAACGQAARGQGALARLDSEQLLNLEEEATRICRNGFANFPRRNLARHDDGVTTLAHAETNVVIGMWTVLAYRARCTSGAEHAWQAEQELLGDVSDDEHPRCGSDGDVRSRTASQLPQARAAA